MTNTYSKAFYSSKCLEESLANSYLFDRHDSCHIELQYLRQELLSQGAGYCNFINYMGPKFNSGLGQLISQIATDRPDPNTDAEIMTISEISEFTNLHLMQKAQYGYINCHCLHTNSFKLNFLP